MPAKNIAPFRGNPGPRLNMVTVYSVSVGHNREPYKNGGTDRSAVWDVDSGRPMQGTVY